MKDKCIVSSWATLTEVKSWYSLFLSNTGHPIVIHNAKDSSKNVVPKVILIKDSSKGSSKSDPDLRHRPCGLPYSFCQLGLLTYYFLCSICPVLLLTMHLEPFYFLCTFPHSNAPSPLRQVFPLGPHLLALLQISRKNRWKFLVSLMALLSVWQGVKGPPPCKWERD